MQNLNCLLQCLNPLYDTLKLADCTTELYNSTELILTRSFLSVTLLEGNTVILSCIPSVIETVLSWTHNGTVVNEDKDAKLSPMNLNHNLILHNTDEDDNGQYICRAVLGSEIVEQNISVTIVPGRYV